MNPITSIAIAFFSLLVNLAVVGVRLNGNMELAMAGRLSPDPALIHELAEIGSEGSTTAAAAAVTR